MKIFFRLGSLATAVALLVVPAVSWARVSVSVNGQSNGEVLYGAKGPSGIDSRITVSRSAGSIASAKARAVFHRYKVNIGNQVISAGTAGDDEYTHVRAGSLFFGKAKFVAATPGATVKNFKITYHVDGEVKCLTPDDSVPEGYSKAFVESQIRFNDRNKFAGTETVDGVSGDDGGTGNFAGRFAGSSHEVSIDHNFKVNLGTVKDQRTYPMLFFGATLVSYAADVPITYCAADFMDTSKFSVDDGTAAAKGQFKIYPARLVDSSVDPQPWDLLTSLDVTVYLEDEDEDFLDSIDVNQVQLFERLGDSGSIQPEDIGDTGDIDSDGIPDRGIQFDGTTLLNLMDIELFGLKNTTTMYLIGETTDGTPLQTSFTFNSTPL